jgi:hypothetical protein
MKKSTYNFNEKKTEFIDGKNFEVWQNPKYIQSKKKAIELIEEKKYNLSESDFWILMNKTKSGKMAYTGLIISHNGCLKINDILDEKDKFKPSSVKMEKDENNLKVMSYINDEQGIYEFGEISDKNCRNAYPYAMLLKRLQDRVILKNSKIAFDGIYSECESEEFKDGNDEKKENVIKKDVVKKVQEKEQKALIQEKGNLVKQLEKYINDEIMGKDGEIITKEKILQTKKVDDLSKISVDDLKSIIKILAGYWNEQKNNKQDDDI